MSKWYQSDKRYLKQTDSYTKDEVDTLLDAKADASEVYTDDEVDALLDLKADAANVYTRAELDAFLDAKADKSDTYTKSEVDSLVEGATKEVVTVSGTSYTISTADAGRWLRFTSDQPVYVSWPDDLGFQPGQEVEFFTAGDGDVYVFANYANRVLFNDKDDFWMQAKHTHVRALCAGGDIFDCIADCCANVTFGAYSNPYYDYGGSDYENPTTPWTPASISTELWLDASDDSSITTSGSDVTEWADLSGNDRHATDVSAGTRPSYDGPGDQVVFNTVATNDNRLTFTIPASVANGDWVYAATVTPTSIASPTGYSTLIQLATGNLECVIWRYVVDSPQRERLEVYYNGQEVAAANGTWLADDTDTHVVSVEKSGTTLTVYLDGEELASETVSSLANGSDQTGYIGYGTFSSGYSWIGGMHEVVVAGSSRETLEGYMAWRWGVEDSLPVDHPYKDAAPAI